MSEPTIICSIVIDDFGQIRFERSVYHEEKSEFDNARIYTS